MALRRLNSGSLLALLAIVGLAGCGGIEGVEQPPPTATSAPPTPLPTSTVSVGFAVRVTSVPTRPPRPHRSPTARPTPFRPGPGPWLQLVPPAGPPASRTITLHARHLPPRSPAVVVWSAPRTTASVQTNVVTGPSGDLNLRFTVPAAQPGSYQIAIQVNGVTYASATYLVESSASLLASAVPTMHGDRLTIQGSAFLPHTRLLLLAYTLTHARKPIVLGFSRTGPHGAFNFRTVTNHLAPGQYVVRAYAAGALTAQMAETYLVVVA